MNRLPLQAPHSIEAEQSVLGGLMLNNRVFDDVGAIIGAGDFYRTDHQLIFTGISEILSARKACDFVTLTEHLRGAGKLEDAGGASYLGSLAADTYSIANVLAYAGIVRERAVLRGLIAAGADIGDMGYRPEGREPHALLDEAERMVFELRSRAARAQGGPQSYAKFIGEAEAHLERQHAKGGGLGGRSTGLRELDAKTNGMHPGDLIIVAARPGLGKTTLAMNIAEHVALDQQARVAVFSMEMQGAQIALRTIAHRCRVSLAKLRGGNLSDDEWAKVAATSGVLRTDLIRLDESPSLSPMDIRARARRIAAEGELALIVVDYLQLMVIPGFRENRNGELSTVTRSLKALAKELRCPVIALSQLSRAGDKEGRRPKLSDLRDSGGIESDADLVLFVHRDQPLEDEDAEQRPSNITEIIIGKQRQGASHTIVRLKFLGDFCHFTSLDQDDWEELKQQRAARAPKRSADRGFGKLAASGDA